MSDESTAVIDSWDFTYWPDKPKSRIIQNSDGTFSVEIEKDFVPLISRLNALFEFPERFPENETYIGDAKLRGKRKPKDVLWGNPISYPFGMVVSNKFLNVIQDFKTPDFRYYPIRLSRGKKEFLDHMYLVFLDSGDEKQDIYFKPKLTVSEDLKSELEESNIEGFKYTIQD